MSADPLARSVCAACVHARYHGRAGRARVRLRCIGTRDARLVDAVERRGARPCPARVVLRFNEAVETAFGSVRVYDGAARRVDEGGTTRPRPERSRSGFARGFRAGRTRSPGGWCRRTRIRSAARSSSTSASRGRVPPASSAQVLDEQGGRGRSTSVLSRSLPDVRSSCLCVGGALALALVLEVRLRRCGGRSGRRSQSRACSWRWRRWSGSGSRAPRRAGSASTRLSARRWSGRARDPVRPGLARPRVSRPGRRRSSQRSPSGGRGDASGCSAWAASALGVAIAITPASVGPRASGRNAVAVASDWVHVLAAAAWIGGLAFLLVALWRARDRALGGGRRGWCRASRRSPSSRSRRCWSRASSTASSRCAPGAGSGRRPTGSCCSSRWHSSYRCSP